MSHQELANFWQWSQPIRVLIKLGPILCENYAQRTIVSIAQVSLFGLGDCVEIRGITALALQLSEVKVNAG